MIDDKHDFFRSLENYILMNNDIMRRDFVHQSKLNPVKVNPVIFKKKFGFTDDHFAALPEFDGYVCEPEHLDYQQVFHGSKWNTYGKVKWEPSEGEWPTIHKLLNHLYGENSVEEDQLEEIYDYHTVMIKWPKQKLQARVLYSHTQGTSKSALAELERFMFQDNYSKIRDNELESDFNSIWVNSILLHIDEPEFTNPKKMSRKIRDLVTSPVMNLRKMKTDYEKVAFHAKLLFTTNDSNFMPFQKSDRRYWIREIPAFKKEDQDSNFNDKMKEEVNHYIHFLLNREMKYKEKAGKTFWLPDTVCETNGFKKLVEDNTSSIEAACKEVIEQYFLKNKSITQVQFRLIDIKEAVATLLRTPTSKIKDIDIVVALRESFRLEQPSKNTRPKKHDHVLAMDIDKNPGKWWIAYRDDFDCEVSENDIFDKVSV